MHRDALGIGRALYVLHQRVSAADEQKPADDHGDYRHNQLACRQIILVQKRGGNRKRKQNQAIPENAGL